MTFDYGSAMKRVDKELSDIVEEIKPKLVEHMNRNRATPSQVSDDYDWKAYAESHIMLMLGNTDSVKKFDMLRSLKEGAFWRAFSSWENIKDSIDSDSNRFYLSTMIEQAKVDDGIHRPGYTWMLTEYINGTLKELIKEEELEDLATKGFWEMANHYFSHPGISLPSEDLNSLVKFERYIDFTTTSKYRKDYMTAFGVWGGKWYLNCFERNKDRIALEDAGFLARPIIEYIIMQSFGDECGIDDPRPSFAKKISRFKDYMKTDPIKDLIKLCLERDVKHINYSYGEWERQLLAYEIESVIKLESFSEDETKDIISNVLLKEFNSSDKHGYIYELVDMGFKLKWLNEEAASIIGKESKEYLKYKTKEYEVVPYAYYAVLALENGYIERKIVKNHINNHLKEYISRKELTKKSQLEKFQKDVQELDKRCPGIVDKELYSSALEKSANELKKKANAAAKAKNTIYDKQKSEK